MQTGIKNDEEKLDWSLLPIGPIEKVIKVLSHGAEKYSKDNWKNVPDAKRRYLNAAFRHLSAISDGQWMDEDSGQPHAACAVCSLLFLLWFGNRV